MKLHYLHTSDRLRSLVLSDDRQRIELHIKPLDDDHWALVALAGKPDDQPGRVKCQGPYHRAEQAEAALRGIAASLIEQGYQVSTRLHAVWTIAAQRHANAIREGREAHSGDYAFDPDQHEPLW
ncbi:hypothetical protein QQM79_03150 [Marinobacteraceae bacterium S3BR75-40.1]